MEKIENQNITFFLQKQKNNSTKTLVFPCFFGNPESVAEIWRIIFRGRTKPRTEKKENLPKIENAKNGKHYISPDFLMCPKGRVNKQAGGGGGVFLTQLGRQICFWTLVFEGPFSKVESTQTLLYYKNSKK